MNWTPWRKHEERLDKELQFHLQLHADDLIARGVEPEEARRQARLALGGPEQVKEGCRDQRSTHFVEELLRDLRYAARVIGKNPGFAAVSVLTLALGIGATTAIFSAVYPVLFQPLPYPDASRLVTVWYAGADGSRGAQAFGTYRELAARSRVFDGFTVYKSWQPTLTGAAEPERLDGQSVSAGYFRVLGVAPAVGRGFDAADDLPHGPSVAILADSVWRRRFHADPAIVGQQITLNDNLFTVAGVMPAGFENVAAPSTEIWSLLQFDPALPAQGREWGHNLRMLGRVRPGFRIEDGRQELDSIAHSPAPEFPRQPWAAMKQGLIVNVLQEDVTRGVKPALLAILGAVFLVLAIACVNVTNLLLARGAQRRGEFAMRAALGAGRARLLRQAIAESLLLGLAGGVLGMFVAEIGVRGIVAFSPSDLPRVSAIHVDLPVFAFGLIVTMLIGLAVGLVPALHVSRSGVQPGLKEGWRHSTGGHQGTRRTLVVMEVALAVVLLVSAGLLLRSMERLFGVAPGFDPSHVLTMQVEASSSHRFPNPAAVNRYYADALEAVRRVPGVTSAAFTSEIPLSGSEKDEIYNVRFEKDHDPSDHHEALRSAVSPGYFETMGIPLLRGRVFDAGDRQPSATRPVVISQSFAQRKFAGTDPIGQRVRFGGSFDRPWDVIVGVVGDVKQLSLAAAQTDSVYVSSSQWLWADNPMSLVVRTQGDAASLSAAVKQAVWSIDKDQPITRVATMEHLVAASAAQRRFALNLFEAFALAALLLAAVGIFGVLSGSVTERMREMGVRSALGASARDILALVIRQGMTLTGLGAAIGLVAAVIASRALIVLLFAVSPLDPMTYAGVVVLLAAVAAIACWVPGWRAARVDPAITLRGD
jgi:putative ABC transport system permease protein